MSDNNFCYYFAYGSNVLERRFRLQILGGSDEFNGISLPEQPSFSDTTLYYQDEEPLKHRFNGWKIFFARKSPIWENKGMAFVEKSANDMDYILGRLYKVTEQQLNELQIKVGNSIAIYGVKEKLPLRFNGLDIFTLTCKNRINANCPCSPAQSFKQTILDGLVETGWTVNEIGSYKRYLV